MRANLGAATMAEQRAFALAEQVGRREAYERVAREGVPDDLDPTDYLGSAETFVDRVLALYRSELA